MNRALLIILAEKTNKLSKKIEMIEVKPFSEKYLPGIFDVILPIKQKEFEIPITLED